MDDFEQAKYLEDCIKVPNLNSMVYAYLSKILFNSSDVEGCPRTKLLHEASNGRGLH